MLPVQVRPWVLFFNQPTNQIMKKKVFAILCQSTCGGFMLQEAFEKEADALKKAEAFNKKHPGKWEPLASVRVLFVEDETAKAPALLTSYCKSLQEELNDLIYKEDAQAFLDKSEYVEHTDDAWWQIYMSCPVKAFRVGIHLDRFKNEASVIAERVQGSETILEIPVSNPLAVILLSEKSYWNQNLRSES